MQAKVVLYVLRKTGMECCNTDINPWDFTAGEPVWHGFLIQVNKRSHMSKAIRKTHNEGEKGQPEKNKKRKTVKELRDRHLKDKNHVITDEDIHNLRLEPGKPDDSTSHTPDIPEDKNRPKDEDKDPKIITPWDVIE